VQLYDCNVIILFVFVAIESMVQAIDATVEKYSSNKTIVGNESSLTLCDRSDASIRTSLQYNHLVPPLSSTTDASVAVVCTSSLFSPPSCSTIISPTSTPSFSPAFSSTVSKQLAVVPVFPILSSIFPAFKQFTQTVLPFDSLRRTSTVSDVRGKAFLRKSSSMPSLLAADDTVAELSKCNAVGVAVGCITNINAGKRQLVDISSTPNSCTSNIQNAHQSVAATLKSVQVADVGVQVNSVPLALCDVGVQVPVAPEACCINCQRLLFSSVPTRVDKSELSQETCKEPNKFFMETASNTTSHCQLDVDEYNVNIIEHHDTQYLEIYPQIKLPTVQNSECSSEPPCQSLHDDSVGSGTNLSLAGYRPDIETSPPSLNNCFEPLHDSTTLNTSVSIMLRSMLKYVSHVVVCMHHMVMLHMS